MKVGDSVDPGTCFNNAELLCSGLGNFVKGLDAPLVVQGATATTRASPTASTTTVAPPITPGTLPRGVIPRTGGGGYLGVGGMGMLLGALTLRLCRRSSKADTPRRQP